MRASQTEFSDGQSPHDLCWSLHSQRLAALPRRQAHALSMGRAWQGRVCIRVRFLSKPQARGDCRWRAGFPDGSMWQASGLLCLQPISRVKVVRSSCHHRAAWAKDVRSLTRGSLSWEAAVSRAARRLAPTALRQLLRMSHRGDKVPLRVDSGGCAGHAEGPQPLHSGRLGN